MNLLKTLFTLASIGVVFLAAQAAMAAPVTLYVAPDGNDGWSGRLAAATPRARMARWLRRPARGMRSGALRLRGRPGR